MRAMAERTGRTSPQTWPPSQLVMLPENRSAWVAVRRLASALLSESARCPFNPLVLHGPPGTGKTLLANVLHERVAADRTVIFVAAADWLPGDDRATTDARVCDLLVIEDLQHLPARAAGPMITVIDQRRNRGRPTLVTASPGPGGLDLPARLMNRLVGGLVVGLAPLSPASRLELMRRLAAQRGITADEAVLTRLARSTSGSARQLLAALRTLEGAGETGAEPAVAGPALDQIAKHVGRHYRVALKQLRGRDRHPQTLWPRQVSMYLARKLTGLSLAQIGEYFGRDHSTVRHACQKVAARARDDVKLPGLLRQIEAELA